MLIRDKYKRLCVIENGSFFSMSSNSQMKQSHLTKFQFLKLLSALALPLAVAIFTAITTVQNRQIAYANKIFFKLKTINGKLSSLIISMIYHVIVINILEI